MKRFVLNIFLLLGILMSVKAQTNESNYKITAKISGLNATKAQFRLVNEKNPNGKWIDIPVEKDHFAYEGYVAEPTVIYLSFNDDAVMKYTDPQKRGYFMSDVSTLVFIAYPNANIKVKGKISDFVDAYPYGDAENELLTQLNKRLNPVLNRGLNILLQLGDKSLSKEVIKEFESEKNKLDVKANEIKLDFANKHISSVAGLIVFKKLIGGIISFEKTPNYISKIDSKYKTSTYYKAIIDRYNNIKEERISKEQTKVGSEVPEIKTTNTVDGSEFNLKSLRGKYVLLDFWGTWCGACVNGMPDMKAFRDKHKAKMQIVGIASESRNIKPWKNLIKSKNLDWPHIYVGKKELDFVKTFGISAFPTKILISPEGKILLRHVGEDPEFYNELEKLVK